MRSRERILSNLETQYKSVFDEARNADDNIRMSKLDFEFQRDQLVFEILLDIRDSLIQTAPAEDASGSLLDKAEKLRRIARLR